MPPVLALNFHKVAELSGARDSIGVDSRVTAVGSRNCHAWITGLDWTGLKPQLSVWLAQRDLTGPLARSRYYHVETQLRSDTAVNIELVAVACKTTT